MGLFDGVLGGQERGWVRVAAWQLGIDEANADDQHDGHLEGTHDRARQQWPNASARQKAFAKGRALFLVLSLRPSLFRPGLYQNEDSARAFVPLV